jgi:hypothetical protein
MASFQKTTLETVGFGSPKIPAAPLVVDDWTLAFRLGFSGKAFWYILGNRMKLYKVFKIKKASGGLRTIHAPTKMMKVFLSQVRSRILLPLCEQLGAHIGAYQVGKSTRDSAVRHLHECAVCAVADSPHTCIELVREKDKRQGFEVLRSGQETCPACQPVPKHECTRRGVKIHMDLKDFFGSTRRAWIRKYFMTTVGYNNYVSNLLATAMTVEFDKGGKKYSAVPQGAPTSGDICNLVADVRLDQPLMKALEGTGWVYSRYADDIYLSHPQNLSQDAVNQLIAQVNKLILASGYRMNRKKLHVQRPHRRQQLLGVVLNQKINVPLDAMRRMRAILNNCYHHGFDAEAKKAGYPQDKTAKFIGWIGGRLSYMQMVNPHRADKLKQMFALARARYKAPEPLPMMPIIDDGTAPLFRD